MFDIHELTTAQISAFTGKAALKALQNEHTFNLDLLVRESIQNSSDAAIDGAQVVKVYYNIGSFQNDALSVYFDTITSKLDEKYGGKTCSYLEIRDLNTVGLTGETVKSRCTNDTKSNFMRLIFDMGKGQDQLNAGGNWGYGKTVYYRVGNGLVIYYSRIKKDEGYESRLMLTLIENEEKADALLRKDANNSAGRAWWGEKDKTTNDFYPITYEPIINDFLAVFGIKPFGENETGTSIIIPYIDTELLMDEAKSGLKVHDPDTLQRCTFINSISDYLKYAVQKWYAPVINNFKLKKYGRKFLNVYVNGPEAIQSDEMYPIFRLVQDLYSLAYAKSVDMPYSSSYGVVCKEVPIYHKKYKSGVLSFCKIKIDTLNRGELLLSPDVYLNLSEENYNGVVSLYTRDLGMILNYEESWIDRRDVALEADEILVSLFVPKTKLPIEQNDEVIELGEYLRQREESDHMKWDDDPPKTKIKCVKFIKNASYSLMKNYFNPEQAENYGDSNVSEFAGILGEKLFPRKKKKQKEPGGGSGGGGGITKTKKFVFAMPNISITNSGKIHVAFDLDIKESVSILIKTKVSAGVDSIDYEKWIEKIGTEYPLKITNFTIESKEDDVAFEESNCELKLSSAKNTLKGFFEIEASDKTLAFVIDCQEIIEGMSE